MLQLMKMLSFFIAFFLLVNGVLKSQPIHNDTVVCIIDTTNNFVKFTSKPFPDRAPEIRWQVSIQGHYYDNENLKIRILPVLISLPETFGMFFRISMGLFR
jgi:hypothetical protein